MPTAEAWLLGELGSGIAQANGSVIQQLFTGGLPWATCGPGTVPGPGPSSEREGQNSSPSSFSLTAGRDARQTINKQGWG